MNLAHWVRERATSSPDAVAVRQGDVALTYAELDRASAAMSARLRDLGVAPGDRVVFTSGEHMETRGATNTLRLLQIGEDGRASGLGEL